MTQAGAVAPAEFTAFAAAALPRLEAPFTDVYRAYDGYRRDLAAWQAQYGTGSYAATDGAQVAAPPKLAYLKMDQLLRWDARERPIRTASR